MPLNKSLSDTFCIYFSFPSSYVLLHASRKTFSNVKVSISAQWTPSIQNDSAPAFSPGEVRSTSGAEQNRCFSHTCCSSIKTWLKAKQSWNCRGWMLASLTTVITYQDYGGKLGWYLFYCYLVEYYFGNQRWTTKLLLSGLWESIIKWSLDI